MTTTVQVTFDCADPHVMACFWAAALGYEKESHVALVKELLASKRITPADVKEVDGGLQFADVSACRDPEGVGPRLFFQRVPESKRTKNRVHLDLHVGPERTSPRLPDSSHWGPSGCGSRRSRCSVLDHGRPGGKRVLRGLSPCQVPRPQGVADSKEGQEEGPQRTRSFMAIP